MFEPEIRAAIIHGQHTIIVEGTPPDEALQAMNTEAAAYGFKLSTLAGTKAGSENKVTLVAWHATDRPVHAEWIKRVEKTNGVLYLTHGNAGYMFPLTTA